MDILPVKDVWYRRIQRCYLPTQCFSNKFRPGSWIICHLSDGSEVISRAFLHSRRIFSKNLVYLDQSVVSKASDNNSQLQVIDYKCLRNIKDFQSIAIEVCVRDISCPEVSNRASLGRILRKILRLFTFSVDYVILLEDITSLPIVSIRVTSTREGGIGSVNDTTSLRITNIIFRSPQGLREHVFVGYSEIEETMSDILMRNQEYLRNSTQKFPPPNEILLVGSSGVGKTSLIHHLAKKFHCNLFSLDSNDFQGQYPGESEELLEKFFRNITKLSKNQDFLSLVVIEDIDVHCPKDSSSEERKTEKFGTSLINFLERISGIKGILVVATAKDVSNLSGSARRKGRLEVEIFIRNPYKKQREVISGSFLDSLISDTEETELPSWIADRTSGFVAGDLKMLMERAIEKNKDGNLKESLQSQLKLMRLSSVKSSNLFVESDSVEFDNLGGLNDLKKTIEVAIVAPLKDPTAFDRMGIDKTKGILLYGPPGCAKTTIVRALAKRTHMPLLAVSPAQVYSPYVGDSERFLTRVFHEARMCTPSILFIDELDALVGCRHRGSSSDVQSRILAVLLTALDGIGRHIDGAPEGNILVVAATNRPDVIDEALMRPGRFDKLIHVPPPLNRKERLEILQKLTEKMPLKEVNLDVLAESTGNFSGADLKSLCREATLHRLTVDISAEFMSQADFLKALDEMRPSLTDAQIAWYRDFERKKKIEG